MYNIKTRRRGISSARRRTVFAGNWPYALRPVPGKTEIRQFRNGIEVPEEPIEVQSTSTNTGRYTIRYVNRR